MKITLKITLVVVALLFSVVALLFSKVVYELKVEDNIYRTFKQVVWSLEKYCEEHSNPPKQLKDLVPVHFTKIPSSEYVEKIEYKLRNNGTDWELRLHFKFLGKNRFITVRSNNKYDDMNKDKLRKIYHADWYVWET